MGYAQHIALNLPQQGPHDNRFSPESLLLRRRHCSSPCATSVNWERAAKAAIPDYAHPSSGSKTRRCNRGVGSKRNSVRDINYHYTAYETAVQIIAPPRSTYFKLVLYKRCTPHNVHEVRAGYGKPPKINIECTGYTIRTSVLVHMHIMDKMTCSLHHE